MYGIAMDLGTSGFRLQLIDLESKNVLKTIMTMKHPLPGGNVIDHLGFAIQVGGDVANNIMISTIRNMFEMLPVPPEEIKRIAVCGNPIQLSLFQNIEIRDLAYAGKNMQQRLGIGDVKRGLSIYDGIAIFGPSSGLNDCEVIVLPSIEHEIGADALAMMVKTDFMDQEGISLVTDYGTNAEMALKVNGRIITCSAAAGPAIEGQGIKCGMLASPGAISDVNEENGMWRLTVLDERMDGRKSHLVDPLTGSVLEKGEVAPEGITGTGVIAAISLAMGMGLIKTLPHLPNGKLILGEGVELNDRDIEEAGKAIGAIRAAHMTLLVESGLMFKDLEYMYMSGASGTYVDADKARKIGLAPGFAKKIIQFGNTSLELAKDVVLGNYDLDEIQDLADRIKADHIMLASNETFKNIYACELAYWTEGMPEDVYNNVLESFNMPHMPALELAPVFQKRVKKDISNSETVDVEIMKGMNVIIEEEAKGCMGCRICEQECPENAIRIIDKQGKRFAGYAAHLCLGMSCQRCIRICPAKAIRYREIRPVSTEELSVM
jgi:methylamine methyltransferase corrinoid activation protein